MGGSVYIGEAENVHERSKRHLFAYQQGKEPYYWTQAIAFVGADLNKALIRCLEDRLFTIAKSSRAIMNSRPQLPPLRLSAGTRLAESEVEDRGRCPP